MKNVFAYTQPPNQPIIAELLTPLNYDNWLTTVLSLLSTHLQLESWIAGYIQWPKYENMQKCPKSKKKLIANKKKQ